MSTKTSALVFAIVMVFSSFVGCIDTEEEETNTATSPSSLGNVMVSTYHVAELVRAVGGDRVTVEIISPSNVPVHDYEPSAADLIRLQDVDLFFYHGLNLEPWVDSTISSLGDDAPLAVQTHAMPSGENTLDYQSMLLNNICEALNDDAYESVTLADHHDEAGDVEIHAEAMTHKVTYPEMDDDHDGDGIGDNVDPDHDADHHDHGDDHDDHAGEDDVHIDDEMMEVVHSIWNESDADMDGNLSGTELVEFIHDMDILFEAEEGVGYATIHIEAEGEYGFAVPAGVDMYILMAGDGHEGHDDHSGHDDHGDEHGDDHSDEDGDDHSDEEEALEYDPHSWLDPVAYKTQVQIVLDEMKKAFPDLADTFQANADAFMASLDEIDANYEAAFGANGTCTNRSVAANHNAYSYIAYRYDLQFVTVHGLDPEGEPSAADIAKVVEKIEEDEISVLFVEEYTDVTAVNSIVEQTNGVSVQVLYTMELPPKDSNDDYLSLMDKNLESLKAGLGC